MRRPVVALHWLLLATIGYVVVIGNQPLWLKLLEIDPSIEGRLAAFHLLTALAALFTLLLIPTTHRFLLKPLLFVLLLVVALVSWFEGQFGIVIDSAIIQSALETDRMEAGELMSLAFFGHLAIQWLLPIAVVAWVRIDYGRFRYLPRLLIGSVFASGILALALLSGYKEISLLLRHHDELKMMVNPTYALFSTWKVLSSRVHTAPLVREALGDAVTTRDEQAPPRILVLVVGETARADHFSLNGYPRATNPRLGARSLINFGPVASCGTATAVSLPCLFSHYGRREFDVDEERKTENMLHLLARAGVEVLWRENNTGCKGVCQDFETENLRHAVDPELCEDGRCVDEILLEGLEQRLLSSRDDLLVVLHQAGSHGPSYYRRYPEEFKQFEPVCNTDTPQNCSRDELVNAYDNTILYTDYFLDRVIAMLERLPPDRESAMLYVSDHGESLGEYGIYLHGLPYALAPDAQKEVPFMMWLSDRFRGHNPQVESCLQGLSGKDLSHDNIFHSTLGFFDVDTPTRDPRLDLFASCGHPELIGQH